MFRYLKRVTNKLFRKAFQDNMLEPPSAVRGMKVLDRTAFEKTINFPALSVPVKSIKECKKILKSKLPSLKMKPLVNSSDGSEKTKLLLLNPEAKLDSLDIEKLNKLGIQKNFHYKETVIGYEHFKARDIFRAILPKESDGDDDCVSPKGFSQVGHVIQLNLRAHQLPYKKLIGEVLLDKVPTARTIVNKVENVSTLYRNLDMELLAGESNYLTRVVEHHRIFELDFSKVFWNSRLGTEHNKISTVIPMSDTVFDVCAGIGPFSIPLAKKGCQVFANDLNPDCHHWMEHNAKLNKVKTMKCFNMDGRKFIRSVLGDFLKEVDVKDEPTVHVLINLPGIAVEFLDAFPDLLATYRDIPAVKVYVYIFASTITSAEEEIRSRVLQHFGHPLPVDAEIRVVRDIAPTKNQYCVSFVIPEDILFGSLCSDDDIQEPVMKKLKS